MIQAFAKRAEPCGREAADTQPVLFRVIRSGFFRSGFDVAAIAALPSSLDGHLASSGQVTSWGRR